MAGKAKPKVAAVAEAVVEQATAVVEAVVEQGKAIVDPPPDPRGYVHVRKRDGMKFYLVRIWTPRSGPGREETACPAVPATACCGCALPHPRWVSGGGGHSGDSETA